MRMVDNELDPVSSGGSTGSGTPVPPPTPAVPLRSFTSPMLVEYASSESDALGKDVWRIMAGFKFYTDVTENDSYVLVPRGYLTDGASVPRPFWDLIPPMDVCGQASAVHDYLCETGQHYVRGKMVQIESRAQADTIFKDAMLVAGVSRWKRNLMYIAVRVYAKLCRPPVPKPDLHKTMLSADWLAQHPNG